MNLDRLGAPLEIRYSEKAVKQLKLIARGDKKAAGRILAAVEAVARDPKGAHDVKVLKGKWAVFKRLRVGNYRVLFDEDGNVLTVYEVKHRQETYHDENADRQAGRQAGGGHHGL